MTTPILTILCGTVQPFRGPDDPSAIGKLPVAGRVVIGRLGLVGDQQADLAVHGGIDKAIHHYPHDHYAAWRESTGDHPLLADPGAFGENISTEGMTEETVCIGDRYRLGTALVEVSQGRQPCWKLDHRFGGLPILAGVVKSRRSGWYYRIIEKGAAAAGDAIALVDRPHPEWTVRRTFGLLIAGDHKNDREGLEGLASVAVMAEPWKRRLAQLRGQ